jgi:hypothetical protein
MIETLKMDASYTSANLDPTSHETSSKDEMML